MVYSLYQGNHVFLLGNKDAPVCRFRMNNIDSNNATVWGVQGGMEIEGRAIVIDKIVVRIRQITGTRSIAPCSRPSSAFW